jgi:hypothetical protein
LKPSESRAFAAPQRQAEAGGGLGDSALLALGLSAAQIHKDNRITVELVRRVFGDLAHDLSRPRAPVGFELVEVTFAKVLDPAEREFLGNIETSFNLSDEKVDRLIAAARRVLSTSQEFAEALTRIRGG